MSFDNISRISTKGDKTRVYLFDVPSSEDEEAIITYLLTVTRGDNKINIKKLTDINSLFDLLRESTTISIKYKSKEYDRFIEKMFYYLEKVKDNTEETSLGEEDIEIINHQYEGELKRKGNTELLKKLKPED